MPDHQSQQLTTPQAAAKYGVPERTLQRAIQTGDLPATTLPVRGNTYMLDPKDVETFAATWRARKEARRAGAMNGEQEVRMRDA